MNRYGSTPNPFPAQFAPQIPASNVAVCAAVVFGRVHYQPNFRQPAQVMNWNLTVERQLATDIVARVSSCRLQRHAPRIQHRRQRAPLPSSTATADNEDERRPYQQFGQITQDQSSANSTYHSLQISRRQAVFPTV